MIAFCRQESFSSFFMSYHFVSNINSNNSGLITGLIQGVQTERLFSMRVQKDDCVFLTDLKGILAKAQITNLNKKDSKIDYKILEQKFTSENDYWNNRAGGKNQHSKKNLIHGVLDKLYMEKLFEILPHSGFQNIYFFEADFSQKQNINSERLDKILIRSLEQSQSLYKPQIKFISKLQFRELIKELKPTFLNCSGIPQSDSQTNSNSSSSYLIGPEGGWSGSEIELFKQLELPSLNLGSIIYPAWLVSNKIY